MSNNQMEPWLSTLDDNLLTDVSKLLNFLQSRLKQLEQHSSQARAVEFKVEELSRWSKIATNILNLRRSSVRTNFVDLLSLSPQPFTIIDSKFNNMAVKVFVMEDNSPMDDEEYSEEKIPPCLESPGFVITKCLRKLRNKHESRDIYSMTRCDVDPVSKTILRLHRSDKFILKRVGKLKSDVNYNTRMKREFKVQSLLSQLNHPSINRLFSYHEDRDSIYAISHSGGDNDLLEHIQAEGAISERTVAKLFKPVVQGLLTAQNLGIAHRDLSLENLVMGREKLEIIDWGHSCCVELESGKTRFNGAVGKQRYFAPELLSERVKECGEYDPFKADVFSLGVCLFTCLTGQMPFQRHGDGRATRLEAGVEGFLDAIGKSERLAPVTVDFLQRCLTWDVEKRSSMEGLLNHEFFSS